MRGLKKEYDTGDPALSVEQAAPFVDALIRAGKDFCRCGDRNMAAYPIRYYPHDAGWTVKGLAGKQWLYIICPRCGYQNALWKLGVKRGDIIY